jgi:small subunit ribosomal protein S8
VLSDEGYIRGFAEVEKDGKELEIELKYFDGAPVISEISASPSRAAGSIRRSRICRWSATASASPILSTPKGVMSDADARDAERRRRILCRGLLAMSRIGKKPITVPQGVTVTLDGQT